MSYEDKTKTIRIPFHGFYESVHDEPFDRFIELEADHLSEEFSCGPMDAGDALLKCIDWKGAREGYAENYAVAFLGEILGDPTALNVTLRSPREYNFSTDTLDVVIPMKVWKEMVSKVNMDDVQTLANRMLEPRSGFVPFYSQNMEEWGDPENWDTPLTEMLVAVLFDQESGYDCDSFQEEYAADQDPFEVVGSHVDYPKVESILKG